MERDADEADHSVNISDDDMELDPAPLIPTLTPTAEKTEKKKPASSSSSTSSSGGGGATASTDIVCIDTQAELKIKLTKNKIERKRKREERTLKLEADAHDMERKKAVLDRIMERSKAMKADDDDNNPLITPGNGASKVAYGRKKTHVYHPTERERILAKPETLVHVDSIAESEATYLQRGYKESLGLENIGDFFMTQSSFVERRPEVQSTFDTGTRMDMHGGTPVAGPAGSETLEKEALLHNWTDPMADAMRYFYTPATTTPAPEVKKKKKSALSLMPPPPSDVTASILKKRETRGRSKMLTLDALDEEADDDDDEDDDEDDDIILVTEADGLETKKTLSKKREADSDRDEGVTFPVTKRAKMDDAAVASADDAKPPQRGKRKVGKKALAKATREKLESEKLMRSQVALADLSGMRQVDADAANFLFQVGENKAVKAKPPRHSYLIRTETPPSGQSNVRAARRDYLNDNGFNEEAARGLSQQTASVPSSDLGALRDRDRGTVPSAIMAGMELRHVAVIDESFFAPDEAQQHLMRKGDKLAIDMAKEQAHPSNLPRLPIVGEELRAREQGRDPESIALRNAIVGLHQKKPPPVEEVTNDDGMMVAVADPQALPLVTVAEDDARQPLYKYFKIFGKAARVSADGMIDELVFDQKRILFNTISSVQLYAPDENNPLLAAVDENGCKILHKNACQRARNIKKQREPVERQAESEPPRLRTRIADARVEFCLERWNRQDAMFINDWPGLADPRLEDLLIRATAEAQAAAKRQAALDDLLTKASYGPLGQLLARHREEILDRGDQTGTRYFVSSEELGTSRLHPSCNVKLPRVKKAHYLAFMEQPRRNERPCLNGHECYCYKSNISFVDATTYFSVTNTMGFVCKEFLYEHEYLRFQLTGELPAQRRTCIVCMLDETTRLAYSLLRSDIQATRVINEHCVWVGTGEFDIRQCIPISWRMISGRQVFSGIVGPFLEFNEGDYLHDVRSENGVPIRFLRYHPPRSGF